MQKPVTQGSSRLDTLDYLRGLAATSIMVYHYTSWSTGQISATHFLGRMGIFGVAIFYILSGLTLTHIYRNTLELTGKGLFSFYKKRALRIFPLLWAATFFSIVLSKKLPNSIDVILNLTGLFGFVKWDTYFATGAWSIGNELVFYSTFPLLLFAFRKSRTLILLISALLTACYVYFSFYLINPAKALDLQWSLYTNPLNQAIFFLSGMALNWIFHDKSIQRPVILTLLISGVLIFLFLPTNTNTSDLVTGVTRIFFSFSSLFICLSFYKSTYILPFNLRNGLSFLGRASYSIYLLHPIVYAVSKVLLNLLFKHYFAVPNFVIALFAGIMSLFVSYCTYEYFETYFIKKGRKSD